MKRLIPIVFMLFGIFTMSYASTRSDVKVLESSENIKYLVQKIAKNYLYYYSHQNKKSLYKKMVDDVSLLESNMKDIAIASKDKTARQILDYFAYEKEQFKDLLKGKPSIDNANEILDISDAISEGAIKIGTTVQYKFTFEEKMLMHTKSIEYIIEKIAKYYLVLDSNIDNNMIEDKLKKSILNLNDELVYIQEYDYPSGLDNKKKDLMEYWDVNKQFCSNTSSIRVPSLFLVLTDGFKQIVDEIAIYHSRGK